MFLLDYSRYRLNRCTVIRYPSRQYPWSRWCNCVAFFVVEHNTKTYCRITTGNGCLHSYQVNTLQIIQQITDRKSELFFYVLTNFTGKQLVKTVEKLNLTINHVIRPMMHKKLKIINYTLSWNDIFLEKYHVFNIL